MVTLKERDCGLAHVQLCCRANQLQAPRIHTQDAVLAVCDENGVEAGFEHPGSQTQVCLRFRLTRDVTE